MSTILFVTFDAGGNAAPAMAIGRQLVSRGHRVRFLGRENQRASMEEAGFEFRAFTRMPYWAPTEATSDLRDLRNLIRMSTSRGLAEDFTETVTADPADLVVVDCMMLSVLKAAESAGQRRVVLLHTFYEFWAKGWAKGPIGLVSRLLGYKARALWSSSSLELVVSDPALDPAGKSASGTRVWSGTVESGVAAGPDRSPAPLLLVSLSTMWFAGQEDVYRRILQALGSLPVTAIVTTGPAVDPAALQAPPNVELRSYAPHSELMPRVTAVIGHGGHSTTMAALAHDLPLILIPMHPMIDQPMVARAVAEAGAGIQLDKKASAEEIGAAITRLLGTDDFAHAAAAIGARLRAADGARVAADRILEAVAQEAPSASRSPGAQ